MWGREEGDAVDGPKSPRDHLGTGLERAVWEREGRREDGTVCGVGAVRMELRI